MARCHAAGELADARIEDAFEAQVFADLGDAVQQLRAAQQRKERAVDALARSRDQRVGGLALGRAHVAGRGHRQALAPRFG
jgi:hypothetical protein